MTKETYIPLIRWRVIDQSPAINHCVVCVAPHTSNWDFVIGHLACYSMGRRMHFLMKKEWFIGPLRHLFQRMGGIAVDRENSSGLTEHLVAQFTEQQTLTLVITPEGTRSPNANWKTGFYRIAQAANVPLLLAALDYEKRQVIISEPFNISGDIDADMKIIKQYFCQYKGKYPDNFVI